jgi:hypothetical protein
LNDRTHDGDGGGLAQLADALVGLHVDGLVFPKRVLPGAGIVAVSV